MQRQYMTIRLINACGQVMGLVHRPVQYRHRLEMAQQSQRSRESQPAQ